MCHVMLNYLHSEIVGYSHDKRFLSNDWLWLQYFGLVAAIIIGMRFYWPDTLQFWSLELTYFVVSTLTWPKPSLQYKLYCAFYHSSLGLAMNQLRSSANMRPCHDVLLPCMLRQPFHFMILYIGCAIPPIHGRLTRLELELKSVLWTVLQNMRWNEYERWWV